VKFSDTLLAKSAGFRQLAFARLTPRLLPLNLLSDQARIRPDTNLLASCKLAHGLRQQAIHRKLRSCASTRRPDIASSCSHRNGLSDLRFSSELTSKWFQLQTFERVADAGDTELTRDRPLGGRVEDKLYSTHKVKQSSQEHRGVE
jgi:hypothetical protein